jgi:DNA-directed RNA polymerase
VDDAAIVAAWRNCAKFNTTIYPSMTPYEPWEGMWHPQLNFPLIKTRAEITNISPMVLDAVNRAQSVGWLINEDVLWIAKWAHKYKEEAFSDIWKQVSKEARSTKTREVTTVLTMAEYLLPCTFYHGYYTDFRGRIYVSTAYLHEQGADIAKGLLLRSDSKPLGEIGLKWLMVSIASNWAGSSGREDGAKTDKIPLDERVRWVIQNHQLIMSYATDPKVFKGWMQADKCWQFLAACMEYAKAWRTGKPEEYVSHLECYIDGSTNGSQHLAMLTRDETSAPYVNLIKSELPGDLYAYVATSLWNFIALTIADLDPQLVGAADAFVSDVVAMKDEIRATDRKTTPELWLALVERLKAFRDQNHFLEDTACFIFWNRIKDKKERRKIVKRGVMTIPYGACSYGMSQQVIDDAKKHGIDSLLDLDRKWGAFMGRLIYASCKDSMHRPMKLLEIFSNAGIAAEKRDEFLSWTVPVTNFKVVQHYEEGTVKPTLISYGDRELKLKILYTEERAKARGRQGLGAAPNIIHSLDAAHLVMIKTGCDFSVTTIHDSYGCLCADMEVLFRVAREKFVELYATDPLTSIMNDISGNWEGLTIGNLDITSVLESEYAFA